MNSEASAVRILLKQQHYGVLSTLSVMVDGFPFGSVTPYSLSNAYEPLIYISDIAQHTKNILNDNRVALTVLEPSQDPNHDPQQHGRATIMGRASVVAQSGSNLLQEIYFQQFPEARAYENTHGFQLFQIEPVKIRYIGGFGQIFWLDPQQLTTE